VVTPPSRVGVRVEVIENETSMVVAEVGRKAVITGTDAAAGSVALGSCPTTSESTGVVTKRDHTTFFSVRGLQRVDRAKRVDRVFLFTHDTRVTTVFPAVGFTERNHFTVVPVFELHNLPVRRYTLPLTVFTHVFNECLVTGAVTRRDHTTFFSVRGLQRVDRAKRVDRVFLFTHDTRVTTACPAVGFTERNHFTVVSVFELHNLPVRRYTLPLTVFTHVFNDCLVTAVVELACPTFAPNNVAAIISNTDNAAMKDLERAALGTDFTTNIAPSTH